jgi:ankyrin repeat protein
MIDFCIDTIIRKRYHPDLPSALKKALAKNHLDIFNCILRRFQIDLCPPKSPNTPITFHSHSVYLQLNSLLHHAVIGGCAEMVKKLLDTGRCFVDFEVGCRRIIAHASDPAVVKLLLDANACVDYYYVSPLKTACEKLQPDSVSMLLDAGAEFNGDHVNILKSLISQKFTGSDTTAHAAVMDLLLVKLVEASPPTRKARVFVKDHLPWGSLLYDCVRSADSTTCSASCNAIVKHNPDLLEDDYEDSCKYTPLIMAVEWKRTPMVKALLEVGADVAAIYNTSGVPGDRQTVLESWIIGPQSHEIDDAMCVLGSQTLGRHMHDTLRLLLDAGLDPTTPVYYRRRDEFDTGRYIFPEETVLMALAQPAPKDGWYEFPDLGCSVFIDMILNSILSRDDRYTGIVMADYVDGCRSKDDECRQDSSRSCVEIVLGRDAIVVVLLCAFSLSLLSRYVL